MSQTGSIVTSRDLRKWAIQTDSDEAYIFLIEIEAVGLTDTIRASSDPTTYLGLHPESQEPLYGTVSNGNTYYFIPFAFIVPGKPEGTEIPRAKLRVDNVARELVQAVRNTATTPMCTIDMVFANTPDTVRQTFPQFRLTSVTYTATSIDGTLAPLDFRAEPFPSLSFLPSSNPGLF